MGWCLIRNDRSRRLGFYPADGLAFEELCEKADKQIFYVVIKDYTHVFYKKLPDIKQTYYNLRKRNHDFSLPDKDDRNFINRILYKLSNRN